MSYNKHQSKSYFLYCKASNPENNFYQKLKFFFLINFQPRNRSKYYIDSKFLIEETEVLSFDQRQSIKSIQSVDYLLDGLILVLLGFSIKRHYKLGYFSFTSRLVDVYLLIKFSFYIVFLSSIKFYYYKSMLDQYMFTVYAKKESEMAVYSSKIGQEKVNSSKYIELKMGRSN